MRSKYQTKQRVELLAYLERMSGQHITVNDACEYFKAQGKSVGTTTIYRQLEKMVDQGIVTKYMIDLKSPACFELVREEGEGEGEDEDHCYHCKCEICQKVIHIHCDEIPQMQEHVREHHGFIINPKRTVFYGVCDECSAQLSKKESI